MGLTGSILRKKQFVSFKDRGFLLGLGYLSGTIGIIIIILFPFFIYTYYIYYI